MCKNKEVKSEKANLIVCAEEEKECLGGSTQLPELVNLFGLVFIGFDACCMASGSSQPPGFSLGNVILLISPDTVLHDSPSLQKSFTIGSTLGSSVSLALA